MSEGNAAQKLPIVEDEVKEEDLSEAELKALDEKTVSSVHNHQFGTAADTMVPIPIEVFPLNSPLPCTLYVPVANRYTLFRRQGEKLNGNRMSDLKKKGTSFLFIHKAFWAMFLKELEKMKLPEPISEEDKLHHFRNLLVVYGKELEQRKKEQRKPVLEKMQKCAEGIAQAIHTNPALGLRIIRRSTDPYMYLTNHPINVGIYAGLIGRSMGYNLDELKGLVFAALIHDIGNSEISKKLLITSQVYSDSEAAEVRSHTVLGSEILHSFGFPQPVIQTALQHHEREDGTGYPNEISSKRIHPYAKITAIADTYDALTSVRPHVKAISSEAAVQAMRQMKGKFDPEIMAVFAPGVGGAPVELNGQEITTTGISKDKK